MSMRGARVEEDRNVENGKLRRWTAVGVKEGESGWGCIVYTTV